MVISKIKLYACSLLVLLVLVQCSTTEPDLPLENLLKKPALVTPGNGSDEQSITVDLTWKTSKGAKNYNIQISEDSEFDSTLVDNITKNKSYNTELSTGTTYYWKIRGINNNSTSPWSDTWEFSTASVEKEPVTVDLLSPSNNSEQEPTEIYFEWNAATNGENYHFQVSTDEEFQETTIDSVVNNTSVELAELEGEQQYYWRVSPILDSETGTWSVNYSFTTTAKEEDEVEETEPTPPVVGSSEFVSVQNSDFVVNGEVYRHAGTNAYHLPNYQKIDPSSVDRAFDAFEEAGVTVVRTWGFYDGPAQYDGDITLQPRAGEYNEEDLRHLDAVIAKGKEHNVRFVLALSNFWKQLGGICEYNKWAGNNNCDLYGGAMSDFINGAEQQRLFKAYISMLLNRVNTVTGVAYKDEPAIFAWEIMNEGRNRGEHPTEIRDWYQDIARYIKSIDENHMVSTGEEGFDEGTPSEYSTDQYSNTYILRAGEGTSYVLNTAIPEIDYGTAHWYPSEWGFSSVNSDLINAQHAWLSDHAEIAESSGKPFLLGEYGYPGWGDSRVEDVYDDFWNYAEEIELDGSLLWQFTADYIKCSEYGGNICWPGGRQDQVLYTGFVDHINAIDALK
ncbi:MAG: hypothetical protein WD059_09020 [Balneolaceae bacterium]